MIIQGYIQASIDWKSIVNNPDNLTGKIVKVYLLAKEGISNPKILGGVSKPLEWTANAIKSLYSSVVGSIQAYAGHGKNRIDDSRPKIGNIVGSSLQNIGGKLHHYVAVASDQDHKFDVISMEADIGFEDRDDKGIVNYVSKLTGLALGEKGKDIPGVEGAELVASMQFFTPETEPDNKPVNKENQKQMTVEEAIKLIKDNGIPASRIYPVPELIGRFSMENGKLNYEPGTDHKIADVIQRHFFKPIQTEFESFGKKIGEVDTLKQNYSKLKSDLFKTESSKHIEKIVKDRGLTDQHKSYLEVAATKFTAGEKPEEEFNTFIDSELTNFKGLVDKGLIKLTGTKIQKDPADPDQTKNEKSYENLLEEESNG